MHFDHLDVKIAQPAAAKIEAEEAGIGRDLAPGIQRLKAAVMFVIVEAIDLQLVKALPVHIQRAFGAGDLPEHAEDPPSGDARGLNHSRRAAVEIDQALNLIVIFYFPPLGIGRDPAGIPGIALRHRTLAQAGLRAGGHFTDPAHQKLGDGQGMGAEVAKGTQKLFEANSYRDYLELHGRPQTVDELAGHRAVLLQVLLE